MKMLINGNWINTERKIKVINPFNNDIVDIVPKASVKHVKQAIEAAANYDFHLTAWNRYEILHTFCQMLKKHENDFSQLISQESGKPLKESLIEIERSYQTFLISAEESKRINGEIIPVDAIKGISKKMGFVLREPIGVIVAITPFNYPLNLVAHKIGPAIAANNPIVLKPSSLTPLTALKMAKFLLEAGLPQEMLHVLTGDSKEIGDELVTNSLVKKITFTGSVPVGKAICEKTGMKKISMELGGNDPLIILKDANIEEAVSCSVVGAFGNNGQRCTSIKRIILEESIAKKFVEPFLEKTKRLKIGNQMDPSTDIGPLITEEAAVEIEEIIKSAISNGAKLLYGAKRKGALFWPSILDNVHPDMRLVKEETFGPIAPIIRVKNFEEAIKMANYTTFGLQSGIFTNDLNKAIESAKRIQAGAVMINQGPGFRAEHLPFGGIKNSGIGREGIKYAINEMTHLKTIIV